VERRNRHLFDVAPPLCAIARTLLSNPSSTRDTRAAALAIYVHARHANPKPYFLNPKP
jgi:hypothetical protein